MKNIIICIIINVIEIQDILICIINIVMFIIINVIDIKHIIICIINIIIFIIILLSPAAGPKDLRGLGHASGPNSFRFRGRIQG
jgi:hypothetical protein